MSQVSNDQLNTFSKEIPDYKEGQGLSSNQMETLDSKTSGYSLEEAASQAIADAIDSLPGNSENIVLVAKRTLEAADNISSLEFENRAKRLEEILKGITQWALETPKDIPAFYKIVYQDAQELRRNGDFYSLDALHDGAVEIAKGGKHCLN